jgi:hypothetical protein
MTLAIPWLERRRALRPAGTGKHHAAVALPPVAERLLPWLGGSLLVAALILGVVVLGPDEATTADIAPLLSGLVAILAIAGLVARRSAQAEATHVREERARPARDQLVQPDGGNGGAQPYLHGMERWTVALLELITHATEATEDEQLRQELTGAAEDTDALRVLLAASTDRDLTLSDVATLHSVSALWETGQERVEELAASVDPAWHRRWRARVVVERLLRHGPPAATDLGLPYRT